MRISYGVHGYGRGHATRAMAALPGLLQKHEVQILAGGDAYSLLSGEFKVRRIPTLRSYYEKDGNLSPWRTIFRNGLRIVDIVTGDRNFAKVLSQIRDFQPDVVISDSEIYTHRSALRLKLPRISFDHFGVLAYCSPPCAWYDRLGLIGNAWLYRMLFGYPDHILVSSFYSCPSHHAGVQCVAPLLRTEVLNAKPTAGGHLLVYLNKPHQYTKRIEETLKSYAGPVHVYGVPRRTREDNLIFLPYSNLPFVEDLASCRAVVSTAGHQLASEAIHLRKPMLVIPDKHVEQRINGLALERLGLGVCVRQNQFTTDMLVAFLARLDEFKENMAKVAEHEWVNAQNALDRCLEEIEMKLRCGSERTCWQKTKNKKQKRNEPRRTLRALRIKS